MKKLALATALAVSPCLASADTILGIHAGAGVWNSSPDGSVGTDADPITADELGLDSERTNYFYAALEHPIPIIPNIRVQHTGLEVSGESVVTREFQLDDVTFSANADTTSDLDLTHTDFTLYYELLDNWATVDLGLTGRQLDGFAYVEGTTDAGGEPQTQSERVDLDGIVPMIYARAQFDLPLTGFHAGGAINYIGYDGDKFSDFDVYVGYMTDGLGLDIGLDLGYRKMQVQVDDEEDLTADVTVDGMYGALTLHF